MARPLAGDSTVPVRHSSQQHGAQQLWGRSLHRKMQTVVSCLMLANPSAAGRPTSYTYYTYCPLCMLQISSLLLPFFSPSSSAIHSSPPTPLSRHSTLPTRHLLFLTREKKGRKTRFYHPILTYWARRLPTPRTQQLLHSSSHLQDRTATGYKVLKRALQNRNTGPRYFLRLSRI